MNNDQNKQESIDPQPPKNKGGRPFINRNMTEQEYLSDIKSLCKTVYNKAKMKKIMINQGKRAEEGDKDAANWIRDILKLFYSDSMSSTDAAKDLGLNFNIVTKKPNSESNKQEPTRG
jgi:acid phosphatase class B